MSAEERDIVRVVTWIGRVERKIKRKHQIELSLRIKDVEKTQSLHVDKGTLAIVEHSVCLQLQALVRATVVAKPGSDNDRCWNVQALHLLECPPEPFAIKAVLKVPHLWKTLQPYEKLDEADADKETQGEDYSKSNHAMIRRILMRLERREPTLPRIRPPHVGFLQMKALEELENSIDLVKVQTPIPEMVSQNCDPADSSSLVGWNLPQTTDEKVLVSARHKLTRQEYLRSKKHPQIAWMRKRLLGFPNQPIRHIVDVGGGRGDLAIELALGLGPHTKVTVVDMNETSLIAGKQFAQQCGVEERINWICKDFSLFAENGGIEEPVDAVVALHACGDLSDMALDYAVKQKAAFLICPCCYSKMTHQNAATKVAEISELPDLSRRGMHIVNSVRYWSLVAESSYNVLLEEYSKLWSSRNMVLTGWPRQ